MMQTATTKKAYYRQRTTKAQLQTPGITKKTYPSSCFNYQTDRGEKPYPSFKNIKKFPYNLEWRLHAYNCTPFYLKG